MANIFFDTNFFINLHTKQRSPSVPLSELEANDLFVSVLTYHIFAYTQKLRVPNQELSDTLKAYNLVEFTEKILAKALDGPTNDLEDNIQLHSAAEAECDYFLTNDKNLLKMKFFGKTQIKSTLSN